MKDRSSALNLAVTTTVALLLGCGALLVLGICDATLDWDIFSKSVERFLYAVFGSSIAMAGVGVAVTLVLGTSECVRVFRLLLREISQTAAETSSRVTRAGWLVGLSATFVLGLLIVGLGIGNAMVKAKRVDTFKRVAEEQYVTFAPKLASELEALSMPPRKNVPVRLFEYLQALDNMAVFNRATVYVRDPGVADVLWGYTAWRGTYEEDDGFARFYPVKAFEKAVFKALQDGKSELTGLNQRSEFEWYGVLRSLDGTPVGALRLDGNPSESLREYIFD